MSQCQWLSQKSCWTSGPTTSKTCRPKKRTLTKLSKQATVWESHQRSDTVGCATGSAEHFIRLWLRFRTVGRIGTGSCLWPLPLAPADVTQPSFSLAVASLSASAFGFFGVGVLPQSPVFFIKKRRMLRRQINNQNIGIAPLR